MPVSISARGRLARLFFVPALSALALFSLFLVDLSRQQARAQDGGEVTVYSYRQPFLIRPLLNAFERDTGVNVNILFAKKGLVERVAIEGENSPADVILTVDIGRLTRGVEEGVTQSVSSPALEANIPAAYRDPEGHWFGLTRRARVVYASKERVADAGLTYESLAEPKWRGRICIRDGQHVYNVALFAAHLAHHGAAATRAWLQGLKANLARTPAGNDRAQVQGVFAGECDLAIGNTYYMGAMQTNEKKPEQQLWADSVRILFPVFEGGGTHVNLSGMMMARHAPNRDNALKLMEYLSGAQAQEIYAQVNFEYPVDESVPWSERTRSWGEFESDGLSLAELASHRKAASRLVDEVDFNQ